MTTLDKPIGASAGWEHMSTDYLFSITDSKCHVFIAQNIRLIQVPQREAAETMGIHPVPIDRALRMACTGNMRDGRSALALLCSEPYLK